MLLTRGLVVVDADPVQLQITVSMVGPCGVDAVLVTDHFPELQTQNGRYHMIVSLAKKAHVCPLAMRFLNEESSSGGYAFLKPDEQKGFFSPFTKSHTTLTPFKSTKRPTLIR